MIEAGRRGRFALKSGECFARVAVIIEYSLQGHDSPRGRMPCAINHSHAAATDFFQNTIAPQLPITIWYVDSGEERVEVLDVRRLIHIKTAAQQTTHAKAGRDSRKRPTSAARAILRGMLRQISQARKIHILIHCVLASAAHK